MVDGESINLSDEYSEKDGKLIEAAKQLIKFGKEIEEAGVPLSTINEEGDREPNAELGLRFKAVFKKVSEELEEQAEQAEKVKKPETMLQKAFKFLFASKAKADEGKEKKKSSSAFGLGSVDNLSAEIERATIHLRSDQTIDSNQNDARILEDVVRLTKLVSLANEPNQAPKMKVEVEKAVTAIANVALTYKYDSPNTSLVAAENKSLDMSTMSMEKATEIKINKPTGTIDVNSMQARFQSISPQTTSISDLPITQEAKKRKAKADEEYIPIPPRNY